MGWTLRVLNCGCAAAGGMGATRHRTQLRCCSARTGLEVPDPLGEKSKRAPMGPLFIFWRWSESSADDALPSRIQSSPELPEEERVLSEQRSGRVIKHCPPYFALGETWATWPATSRQ